ncbi:ROK family protein [Candidatus Villigracilis affinis]|uniref:ROK family protein n=1 Tax=Candidatus Villigracilis affinis TaxID=3140682 RepID=UPI002A21225D|nr:ROK family protein [Anaerolineales bacterium]
MGLTRAAVTLIVNDLIENEVIFEAESRAIPSGRPPVVLEINPKRGLVAAVDMGATHMNIAIADFSAKIIAEKSLPLDIRKGPQICMPEVSRSLKELLAENGISQSQLMAVGIGVPGPVITDAGMVVSPPIMPGWDGYPIRKTLEQELGCAISLNNDAELGALGEWAYGAGRGEKNLAFIKVGSGIGAGLIINQQIYGGTTGSAGEIGHITIDENGPLCTCGNHGCLEAFAGGHAIALQAKKLVESGKRTLLSSIPMENLTAQEVAKAARRGDLPAQDIIMRAGTFIGIAIAGLVNLFNPGAVIIGGGVAQSGDLLTTSIRQAVGERSLRASGRGVHITTAMLGRRSSLMGATVQAVNIAIHDAIEKKNPVSRNSFPSEIKQVSTSE